MAQNIDILANKKGDKDINKPKTGYQPTDEESKIIGKADQEFQILDGVKGEVQKYWPMYRQAYRAVPEYASDGETVLSLNPSVEFQITQAYLAEQHAQAADYDIEPEGEEDALKIPGMKARIEATDINDNVIHKFRANSEQAAKLGMSVMFVGYETENKVMTDSEWDEKEKKIVENTNTVTVGTHKSRVVDMDNFWCDNVYDFDDARQCFEEEYITQGELDARYKDGAKSKFPFKNVEYVKPEFRNRDQRREQNSDGSTSESDTTGEYIKLTHWWHVPNGDGKGDFYRIIANDTIIIRDTELPYWDKMLPYVWKNFIANDLYIWRSMGIPRIVAQPKEMTKLAVDGYFKQSIASTSPEIILRDGVSLEKPLSNAPNAINRLTSGTGNISQDIFERRAGSPDGSAITMAEYAQREIIQSCGIPYTDITQTNVSEKATKAAIRRELQRARQGNYQKEEDKFLERFYTLRMSRIMQYDPMPIIEDGTPKYQKSLLKGEFEFVSPKGKKLTSKQSDKAGGIRKKSDNGFTSIEWTPNLLRGQLVYKVRSGSNLPVFKEVERQNFNSVFFQIPQILQVKQSLDVLKMNSEPIIKKFLEMNNFPMQEDSSDGGAESVEEDLGAMGISQPPPLPTQNVQPIPAGTPGMQAPAETPAIPGGNGGAGQIPQG